MVQQLRISLPVVAFATTLFLQSVACGPEALAQGRRLATVASPVVASEIVNGSISGTVFHDVDADHVQDVGETGIAYATMLCHTLNSDGSIASTIVATTNIEGNYTFSGLGSGNYRLECDSKVIQQSGTSSTTFEISRTSPNVIGTFGAINETTPALQTGSRLPCGSNGRVRAPLMK